MKNIVQRKRELLVLAGLLQCCLPHAHAADTLFDCGAPPPAYTQSRHVRYRFTLQNTKGTPLTLGHLWVHAPVKQTGTQWCRRIETTHPADLLTDKLGDQVLHFKIRDLPPYGAQIVMIKADLDLAIVPVGQDPRQPPVYTAPGPHVQSDAPRIIALGRKLAASTPHAMAKRAFDWISANIKHAGYHRSERGAAWALANMKGDCSEYASLFTAVVRANGIAARRVAGFICTSNAILKPYAHHTWAEFHDGNMWRVCDPQNRTFAQNHASYIALSILGPASKDEPAHPYRLFRCSGTGLKVRMDK